MSSLPEREDESENKRRRLDDADTAAAAPGEEKGDGAVESEDHPPDADTYYQPHPASSEQLNRLLAMDMNALSLNEREQAYNDVHGTTQPVQENEEFLSQKMKDLDESLAKIKQKAAYKEAETFFPGSVFNPALRLMFLRAKRFNAREAAKGIVSHFDTKRNLFGQQKLGKRITQEDLNKETMECARRGAFQLLPQRDKSGRFVFLVLYKLHSQGEASALAVCRYAWYMMMTSLEDELFQRNGMVLLCWMHGANLSMSLEDLRAWRLGASLHSALPLYVASVHHCGEGDGVHPAIDFLLKISSSYVRVRFKCHLGSPVESFNSLSGYGITKDILPVDKENSSSLASHHEWLLTHKTKEDISSTTTETTAASSDSKNDSSDGKSDNIFTPSFRNIIKEVANDYDNSKSSREKREVCEDVIAKVTEDGARFLTREGNQPWEQCDKPQTLKRVGQAFRNRRKRAGKKK